MPNFLVMYATDQIIHDSYPLKSII